MNPTTERVNVMEKKNWIAMPMVRIYNIVVELFIDELDVTLPPARGRSRFG